MSKELTGFSDAERSAMKARAKELVAESKRSAKVADQRIEGEAAIQAAIKAMSPASGKLIQRLHQIITGNAPDLVPRTWYGMPAYTKDEKVVCYIRNSDKFKERYETLGFNDIAKVDDGKMWPVAYAITELTPAEEAKIADLIKQAVR